MNRRKNTVVGAWVRLLSDLRIKRGWTIEQLADRMKAPMGSVAGWLNGVGPSELNFRRIQEFLVREGVVGGVPSGEGTLEGIRLEESRPARIREDLLRQAVDALEAILIEVRFIREAQDAAAAERQWLRLPPPDSAREPPTDGLLKIKEAAAIMGCCEESIRRAHWNGYLKAVKVGRHIRIDPADLRKWQDSGSKTGESR